jgi:hypothetical protein
VTQYDEKAIASAQEKWRKQDELTFGRWDAASMARRQEALLDLLCAHIPIPEEQNKTET